VVYTAHGVMVMDIDMADHIMEDIMIHSGTHSTLRTGVEEWHMVTDILTGTLDLALAMDDLTDILTTTIHTDITLIIMDIHSIITEAII
jgi:hypothetical protein